MLVLRVARTGNTCTSTRTVLTLAHTRTHARTQSFHSRALDVHTLQHTNSTAHTHAHKRTRTNSYAHAESPTITRFPPEAVPALSPRATSGCGRDSAVTDRCLGAQRLSAVYARRQLEVTGGVHPHWARHA